MAARGTVAKEAVINKIKKSFGSDYVGYNSSDKKIYVWADDGGERVQIALSMTCPKNNVDIKSDEGRDFSQRDPEISNEDRRTVNDLIRELGL